MAYEYLYNYILKLQSKGKYFFTREDILKIYPGSKAAVKLALNRLSRKKQILSVRHGFYVIIPVEYMASGILPPMLFIDDLMISVNKSYYLGLLNAAAINGAAHQQPQEYHVITKTPLRTINRAGIRIKFFVKSGEWKNYGLIDHKTDTGYLKVSGPELTAIDLLTYEKRIGGLNRVATILEELSEKINPTQLLMQAQNSSILSHIQRLGYLLDKVLNKPDLVIPLQKWLSQQRLFRVALKRDLPIKGFTLDRNWKVIINTEVESDL
ncbi:MAG: type IV toxin-antitoxin system AbiEi family antitoxin [Candidatus Omnitrophica bacterium]|nr:type IV toxin-antitoxin system AbiEi family antitoxin [Candidatus Omnitrophota bacterium]MCK4422984.1 type IV toxin-antitoxin system AbiEi family antitoxin [Candidatus Omnitrophota bacterium]